MNSALFTFLPLGLVITWGILLLLLGAFLPNERRSLLTSIAALGAAVSGVATLFSYQQMLKAGGTLAPLGNFYVLDTFAVFFHLLTLFALLVTVLISSFYLERENLQRGEYFALLFFSLSGMMILASSKELMTLFVGLEIVSMSVYTLVGYQRTSLRSNEGAFKYFLLGSLVWCDWHHPTGRAARLFLVARPYTPVRFSHDFNAQWFGL
jgi:NADH-quinone oxidoreductase subunit N